VNGCGSTPVIWWIHRLFVWFRPVSSWDTVLGMRSPEILYLYLYPPSCWYIVILGVNLGKYSSTTENLGWDIKWSFFDVYWFCFMGFHSA
jgi:hypothetical protein